MESDNILKIKADRIDDRIDDSIDDLYELAGLSLKEKISEYEHSDKLVTLCKTFEEQKLELYAIFMDRKIKFCNCNAIGDILEDVFFPIIKDTLPEFEEGPKQASPDYYVITAGQKYEFEQKVFFQNPGFDIGNFSSYVDQLCKDDGVYKKLFMTKYLVFEYSIIDDKENNNITIKKFHYLNVFNLVSYKGKYPISMQVKRNIWYNIRPDSVKNWYLPEKIPKLFIDKIIECITKCPNIENKDEKIKSINDQFTKLQLKYDI